MKKKLYKLQSLSILVDEDAKTLYPCDLNGKLIDGEGVLLQELNENCFNYLDRDGREYLSNLVNNK
jgi:hypothetical protein